MEQRELKPCPFCGGKAEIESIKARKLGNGDISYGNTEICCFDCGGKIYKSDDFESVNHYQRAITA